MGGAGVLPDACRFSGRRSLKVTWPVQAVIPPDDLPRILYWIALHPDQGDDSAIHQLGAFTDTYVPGDPIEIPRRLAGAGDNVKFIHGQAENRQVAFESSASVEQSGVNRLADGHVHIVAA